MANLEYGATYFHVTFADPESTMPGIKPVVHVGTNLAGDEKEETHYFQDPVSVQVQGLWQEAERGNGVRLRFS